MKFKLCVLKTKFLKIVLILFVIPAFSQELLPFVENFTKSDYSGDNQNWNSTQGNDNAMYFANNHYFLRYNGVKWEKYTLPNKTVIRSIFADGDKIYCGSYNEFGFWKRKSGKMEYFSLSKNKNIFNDASDNEEIWKIFKSNNTIYFQSFNQILLFKDNTIEQIKIPFQISYCFVVNKSIYVASVKNGVYIFDNKKFTKVDRWSNLENTIIHYIAANKNDIYIFTQKNGVFIDKNGALTVWQNPLNQILKTQIIITAKFIDANNVAIGTAFNGLYIVNLSKNTYVNISRKNSLKNNSVLSIGFDKENDLWLGLDNGISHIEINSPLKIFSDNTGILGSVYAMATTQNGFLMGSNHGVFKYENKNLSLLPNSQGQVWDLKKVNSSFLIGHNEGTYTYSNNQLNKVNQVTGGWDLLKSNDRNAYFQATYSGIVAYYDSNDFSKYKRLEGLNKPIKYIAQNKANELWAADNYRSLYKIDYDDDFIVKNIINISKENNIKNDYGVKLFNFKNQILFLINNIWYNYNPLSNKLEKNDIFNTAFKGTAQIIPIDDHHFIIIKESLLYLITQVAGEFVWELIPEKYYEGKIINHDTKIYLNGNQLYINLDDGFFVYEIKKPKIKQQHIQVEAFYQDNLITNSTKINYNQTVEINLLSEFYGYNRSSLFYKLNKSKTFIPVKKGNIKLNNLESGQQRIEVFSNNGARFVKVASYEFYVLKPWYFSLLMIFIYILLITGSFFLYYRWNKVRYSQKLKLKEEELKHQKEIIQLELDAENKLKLQEYDKHILQIQVQTKASEVAGKSLSIAKQTELIDSIQKILETENDISQLKNKIKNSIKINAINKNEWQSFEKNLMQSNEEFVQKLSQRFPALTSKDIKLCIYLKMNLSSKEIAPLLNISFRGVELHRYRLRKKMGINQLESLSKFMINI